MLNRTSKPITQYRLGWVFFKPDGTSGVRLAEAVKLSTPINTGETADVPATAIQSSFGTPGASVIEFFVAQVNFADGTTWKQNPANVVNSNLPAGFVDGDGKDSATETKQPQ